MVLVTPGRPLRHTSRETRKSPPGLVFRPAAHVQIGDLEPSPGRRAPAPGRRLRRRRLGSSAALFATCRKEKLRSRQAERGVAGTRPLPPRLPLPPLLPLGSVAPPARGSMTRGLEGGRTAASDVFGALGALTWRPARASTRLRRAGPVPGVPTRAVTYLAAGKQAWLREPARALGLAVSGASLFSQDAELGLFCPPGGCYFRCEEREVEAQRSEGPHLSSVI